MFDQLIIEDKASFEDFGASVAARTISPPSKKSIKETVPFSNLAYDFSKINGEVYWEERELEYTFEILGITPQDLEEKKTAFANWVMNVMGERIYDPFIPDYHFLGTYDSMEFEDEDNQEKTTVTVVFTAYPYKISNTKTEYNFTLEAEGEKTVNIVNASSHRITPTITTDQSLTITLGSDSYGVAAGMYNDESFKLAAGVNSLTLKNSASAACNVSFSFYTEVF